jgi:peptide deformylase
MDVVVPDEFKYLYEKTPERPVVKVPDPVLRSVAEEVLKVSKSTDALIDEMLRIMNTAHGIGLAAPQVGVLQRVIIVATADMKPTAFINPVIVKLEGEQIGQEGCLSIPGLYGDVKRAEFSVVEAMDRKGNLYSWDMEGMASRVLQHEVDHLNGVLFLDKVDLATLHWAHPEHELTKAE